MKLWKQNVRIFKEEVEPIVIYDASSYIGVDVSTQILNGEGLNFEKNSKKVMSNSPINAPKFIKKHWSLVLSLRQQLEKD